MINIILFSLFHLSLIAFILYVARFKVRSYNKDFNSLVKVFILLIVIYCILIFSQIGTPIALLYGPIHFSLYRISVHKSPKKYMFLQLLPFFLMVVLYGALYYSIQIESSWSKVLFLYYPIYFVCTIVSSASYSVYIWLAKWNSISTYQQRMLLLQLATIAFVISVFICISFFTFWGRLEKEIIGFDALYIICGLLLLAAGFMISYLVMNRNEGYDNTIDTLSKVENTKYNSSNIERDAFKDYSLILEKVIDDKKLHLNSGLSLDDLSVETSIPKHHLSQLFNSYLGKSFYQYIAERRIQEAIFRIQEDDNITFESLAYECGFNSKTSFNRYFKDITGTTPSEYRSKIETIKEIDR